VALFTLQLLLLSAECLYHPEICDKPVVVGGDLEARHGIVLAKNYIAKKA
jgi:DNA polymerase IV